MLLLSSGLFWAAAAPHADDARPTEDADTTDSRT